MRAKSTDNESVKTTRPGRLSMAGFQVTTHGRFSGVHRGQSLAGSERFRTWCSKFGFFVIPREERPEIQTLPEEERTQQLLERVGPSLLPIWSFFVALCYALQRGENELSAADAYWLGLVDEVFGDEELDNLRQIYEHQPDEQLAGEGEKRKQQSREDKTPLQPKEPPGRSPTFLKLKAADNSLENQKAESGQFRPSSYLT